MGTLTVLGVVVFASYGDYSHLAQNAEAVSLMSAAKAPLGDYFQRYEKWPDNLDDIVDTTNARFTKSIGISKGAGETGAIELTATMRTEGVDRRVAGRTILMTSSDGGKTWTCKRGTMRQDDLPARCQAK